MHQLISLRFPWLTNSVPWDHPAVLLQRLFKQIFENWILSKKRVRGCINLCPRIASFSMIMLALASTTKNIVQFLYSLNWFCSISGNVQILVWLSSTNSMTISTFSAPHCSRARYDEPNEGFFFVYSGVVEINHVTKELRVYEDEEWQKGNASAKLVLNLSHHLIKIEFRMIRSRSRRYGAGRVRITGPIDRGFNEFVTLKMSPDAYHRLGRLLMSIGL